MYPEQITQAPQITAPVANQITRTGLIKKVRTLMLEFRLRATVTLAGGPATAILNGGSVWSAFESIGIDENGARFVDADPRILQVAHQMVAPRDTDHGRVRLTNPANGAYVLEESVFLAFSNLQQAGPVETAYMERNPQQSFEAFVRRRGDSLANILVQTPGTAVISGITVDVVQRYDLERNKKVNFIPQYRTVEQVIAGASTRLPFKIDTGAYLQGVIFQQDTSGAGEVLDIISGLALRSDSRDFIGPDQAGYENLQALVQMEFAGDCVSRGYYPHYFRKGGRLSNIVNVNSLANFRAELNALPSVTAGAGTSTVRALLLELVPVPGLTEAPRFPV
jgi:hypothetical protein